MALLSVNFLTVTVGFFLEDEVTFTLSFLDETVNVVPFFAGPGINLIGILRSFAYLYAKEPLLQIILPRLMFPTESVKLL